MKLNIKGIFKAAIAGATLIGGAVLGLEAKKCFTKPCTDTEDEFDDEAVEMTEGEVEEPAEEAEDDEPEEIPED